MNRTSVKRWTKISLRTLHLLAVSGVGGGVFFALDKSSWINFWWLAIASGGLMMLMDIVSNPVWIVQTRGLVIFVKLAIGLSALSYGIISRRQWSVRLTLVVLGLTLVFLGLPIFDAAR